MSIFMKKQTHKKRSRMSQSVCFINWFITIFTLVSPAAFISTPFNVHKTNCNSFNDSISYYLTAVVCISVKSTPHRSRCEGGGSGPPDWGTSPYGPATGSRSSFLGCHCRDKRRFVRKKVCKCLGLKVSHSKNLHLHRLVNYNIQYIINMYRPVFARAHNVKHKSPCDD